MTDNTLPPRPTDLELKRPAEVRPRHIRVHRAAPKLPARRVETIVGTPTALGRELRRLQSTGELLDTGHRRVIQVGEHAGLVELKISVRPRPGPPRWAKVCVGAGTALGAFSGVGLAVFWLLSSLTGPALLALCAAVLVALVAILRGGSGGGGRTKGVSVSVTTTTSVNVR